MKGEKEEGEVVEVVEGEVVQVVVEEEEMDKAMEVVVEVMGGEEGVEVVEVEEEVVVVVRVGVGVGVGVEEVAMLNVGCGDVRRS